MRKIIVSLVVFGTLFCFVFAGSSFSGKHLGEQNMLDVDIQFSEASGHTVTNADGVFYHIGSSVYPENKVYPRKTGEITRCILSGAKSG